MVGILVSFWDGLFSGAMLVSRSVPKICPMSARVTIFTLEDYIMAGTWEYFRGRGKIHLPTEPWFSGSILICWGWGSNRTMTRSRSRSVSADSATSVSREAKSWASEIDTWLALQWPRLVALIGWKSSTSTKRWRTLSLWQRISTTDRVAHGYPKWRIGCCDLTVDAQTTFSSFWKGTWKASNPVVGSSANKARPESFFFLPCRPPGLWQCVYASHIRSPPEGAHAWVRKELDLKTSVCRESPRNLHAEPKELEVCWTLIHGFCWGEFCQSFVKHKSYTLLL